MNRLGRQLPGGLLLLCALAWPPRPIPPAGAHTWTKAFSVERHTILDAVSCPSVSLCVAVDSAGNVVTGSTP